MHKSICPRLYNIFISILITFTERIWHSAVAKTIAKLPPELTEITKSPETSLTNLAVSKAI
jgi:hypothetical protein